METFYQGECHQIGIPGDPCPENQQLYDRRGLSDFVCMNGQCYQQNEQVFTFKKIDFEVNFQSVFLCVFRDLAAMANGFW